MNIDVSRSSGAPKRRRRTAVSARREILDAAKKRLTDEGPEGLRLKVIAKDIGISHSSIIHHFGSRDGLMNELREDAFTSLAADLKKRLAEPAVGDPSIEFFEKISMTLAEKGNGRLLAWQMMAGQGPRPASIGVQVLGTHGSGGLLDGLAKMLHELTSERARARNQPIPDLEEIRTIVAMFSCTVLGEAIAGDLMVGGSGLGRTPEARRHFRAKLAKYAERMVFPKFASSSSTKTEPANVPMSEPAAADGANPSR
jgi:AcrR family transcriptional regulator